MADEKELAARLKTVPLFAELNDKQLKAVASAGKIVEFPSGKEVTREGEAGVGFHLILSGAADVSVGGSARGTLGEGDYFGEISLIDGMPRSATVTITEPTQSFSIVSWDFSRLLDANPEMMKVLLVELCRRLRATEAATTQA